MEFLLSDDEILYENMISLVNKAKPFLKKDMFTLKHTIQRSHVPDPLSIARIRKSASKS